MSVYERTIEELNLLSEEKFKSFSEKIMAANKPLIGVRTPAIKAIAKKLQEIIRRNISPNVNSDITKILYFTD